MKIGSEEIKGWKDWTITDWTTTLAACTVVYGGLSYCAWSAYQKYTTPSPEAPYEEANIDIVLDYEASADYARPYSIAADLTETGEGALDRIRAARIYQNGPMGLSIRQIQEALQVVQRKREATEKGNHSDGRRIQRGRAIFPK